MFKFKNYEIYVLYSRNSQAKAEPDQLQALNDIEFYNRSLNKMTLSEFGRSDSLRKVSKLSQAERALADSYTFDLVEDTNPKNKKDTFKYIAQIKQSLNKISATKIGQMLLSRLNKQYRVYIIPLYHYTWKYVGITTGPYSESEGGGIRIQFNPDEMRRIWRGPVVKDGRTDILFHELVHAYRKSHNRDIRTPLDGGNFPNLEEFTAAQFENIFVATRRSSTYYSMYDSGYAPKETVYNLLSSNRSLINALELLLKTEPLAQMAANLKMPEYNPFRDFHELLVNSNKNLIDI